MLDNESDKLGPDFGFSDTYSFCDFYLCFDKSVVGILGSDVFVPIGVDSKGGIFASGIFLPAGVNSKGGRLFTLFWNSNSLFYFQI